MGTAISCTKCSQVGVDTGFNVGTSDVATLIKVDPNELALWKEMRVRLTVNCVDHIQYMCNVYTCIKSGGILIRD